MKNLVWVLVAGMLLAACATAGKIGGVRIGMTKDEAIAVMGPPASVSAQGQAEYLNYALSETGDQAFY
jgi:hypothetical protein